MSLDHILINPPGKTLPTWTEKSQANSIREFIVLANNMLLGKLGERLSSRRVTAADKTPEVKAFSEAYWENPHAMIAEWTTWDEGAFVVLEKFFSSSTYYRNTDGSYSTPGQDFYRIGGNEWAFMFRINTTTTVFNQTYYGRMDRMFGEWVRKPMFDVAMSGSYDAMESDMVMYKLMGYTTPAGEL